MSNLIATRVPREQAPRLKEGGMVPLFYLPASSGGEAGPAALRSKYNMVLAFVGAGPQAEAYLSSLAHAYGDIQACQAKVLAVVTLPLESMRDLASKLKLPFALLSDLEGKTTSRILGSGGQAGLCAADRFGQAFYVEIATSASALPSVETAISWLEHIQIQCPE